MATINPYLNFPGNAKEAFTFYKSIFGGEFVSINRFSEMPDNDKIPADAKNQILHIGLPIGNGNILMASDAPASMGFTLTQGNSVYISVNVDSKEEADRIFYGLSEGGKIEMPLADKFWGAYYGTFADRFGIGWIFNYESPKK